MLIKSNNVQFDFSLGNPLNKNTVSLKPEISVFIFVFLL